MLFNLFIVWKEESFSLSLTCYPDKQCLWQKGEEVFYMILVQRWIFYVTDALLLKTVTSLYVG